jgi:hypothetical protein
MRLGSAAVWTAALETTALYGLLVWVYAAAVAATDLDSIDDQLIHWLPLRIDTAGAVGFGVSALSFLLLQVIRPGCEYGRGRR